MRQAGTWSHSVLFYLIAQRCPFRHLNFSISPLPLPPPLCSLSSNPNYHHTPHVTPRTYRGPLAATNGVGSAAPLELGGTVMVTLS